jgi:tetratricopeptide (TPR) repeat protein
MYILMNIYRRLLEYRLYIAIIILITTIILGFTKYDGWFWFSLILAGIAIGSHLFFGPIRFIQEAVQAGDMETAKKHINTVFFPRLLFKPIRQGFYMLKANMAMSDKDFGAAEDLMNKSIQSKSKVLGAGNEGNAYLQLGLIAVQNNKKMEAKKNLRLALEKGLADKESKAAAYIQLCGIELQSRRSAAATNYFKKAKALKPQTKEIKDQIVQLEKHIHNRM